MRWALPAIVIALVVAVPTSSATSFVLFDCAGADHPPFDPDYAGQYAQEGSSYWRVGIVAPDKGGSSVELSVARAGAGDYDALVPVNNAGIAWLPVPIFQYGPHVATWTAGNDTHTQSATIDEGEGVCTPDSLQARSEGGGSGGGLSTGLVVFLTIIAVILVGLLLGYFSVALTGTSAEDPCEAERKALAAAKAAKEKAAKEVAAAEKEVESRWQRIEGASMKQRTLRRLRIAIDALRNSGASDADKARNVKRIEADIKAKGLDDPSLTHKDGDSGRKLAHQDAKQRRRRANEALAEAQRKHRIAEKALDACEGRARDRAAAAAKEAANATKKRKGKGCCPCGEWHGFTQFQGGGVIAGWESGRARMFCMCGDREVSCKWTAFRKGVDVGLEASIGYIRINKAPHVTDVPARLANVLEGLDGDVSLGAGWTKLGKMVARGIGAAAQALRLGSKTAKVAGKTGSVTEVARKLRALDRVAHSQGGNSAAAQVAKDALKTELGRLAKSTGREGAEVAVDAGAKSAASEVQAEGAEDEFGGIHMPLGLGIQIGLWKVTNVRINITAAEYCNDCHPDRRR